MGAHAKPLVRRSRGEDAHRESWSELGVYGEDDRVRAEPFDAIELALGEWCPTPAPATE